jgi:hypothetical protein
MAALTVLASGIAQVFPNMPGTRLRNKRTLVAMTVAQAVYADPTTGKVGLCNTATAGKQQFRGIVMRTAAAGDVPAVLEEGEVVGFDLSGTNFDDLIYAQDTDGVLGTTAGTKSVPVGRVVALSDGFGPTVTKVLRIGMNTLANY